MNRCWAAPAALYALPLPWPPHDLCTTALWLGAARGTVQGADLVQLCFRENIQSDFPAAGLQLLRDGTTLSGCSGEGGLEDVALARKAGPRWHQPCVADVTFCPATCSCRRSALLPSCFGCCQPDKQPTLSQHGTRFCCAAVPAGLAVIHVSLPGYGPFGLNWPCPAQPAGFCQALCACDGRPTKHVAACNMQLLGVMQRALGGRTRLLE